MPKINAPAAPKVRVKVKGGKNPRTNQVEGQPHHEDGKTYQPGEEFIVDEDRADALSARVDVLGPVEDKAAPAAAQ